MESGKSRHRFIERIYYSQFMIILNILPINREINSSNKHVIYKFKSELRCDYLVIKNINLLKTSNSFKFCQINLKYILKTFKWSLNIKRIWCEKHCKSTDGEKQIFKCAFRPILN